MIFWNIAVTNHEGPHGFGSLFKGGGGGGGQWVFFCET